MSKSPFYYGGVVKDEYFCNRSKEIKELVTDIDSGLNVLLYAPRRFGKTSLVLNALSKTEYAYVFLDLMSIVDTEEFINDYFNAVSKSINTPSNNVVTLFKKVLGIRPNIAVEFDMNGMPSFKLNFLHSEAKKVLNEVLDLPYRYAEYQKKKVIVVFDEFQEVVNIGIEEKLRSVLQHHGDKVSYVFLGSKKSVMKRLFFDKNKPFYKSVKHVPIDRIDSSDWEEYIKNGFKSHGKQISEECIAAILEVSKGFPYYSQQIAYELFHMSDINVEIPMVQIAVDSILEKEEDLFWNEWNHLSQNQKKALKLLIYAAGENIYSKETLEHFHFTSSSLKKAIEGVLTKDVVDHKSSKYYFQDPLFEYWLSKQ